MEPTYVSLAPLVQSTEQKGTVLVVVFQDAAGGAPVTASAPLRRSKGVAGATRDTVQRKVLSRLSFAISRAVNQAVGDVHVLGKFGAQAARSAMKGLADSVDSNYSAEEKQAAIVEAFQGVAGRFRWDGSAWVLDSAAPTVKTAFDRQLEDVPITDAADVAVLGRMLAELAAADGDFGDDERSFLETFLLADTDIDGLVAGPKLTHAELRQVSEGPVRETMLMLAWGLSFCDDELAPEEQEACRRYAQGLGISIARGKALRNAAASFVLESAFADAWAGGIADEAKREQALAAAERLGLPLPVAKRIESQYKRSHGIR